ncbi:MAG TPA: glycosyltransferase family 4 protein [Aliidongia sp.]|nr:glycosyltransferase family 4 protein [Aliidongia sp.]
MTELARALVAPAGLASITAASSTAPPRLRLVAFTRYSWLAPSSRYRLMQFVPILAELGIDVQIDALFGPWYTDCLVSGKRRPLLKLAGAYLNRIRRVWQARSADILWIEKELLPWLPWWMERLTLAGAPPRILDFDDSQFHRYDLHSWRIVRALLGRRIDRAMAAAELVSCGSPYIAERARQAGAAQVVGLPTVLDLTRYPAAPTPPARRDEFVIGWIGLPQNGRYLEALRAPLLEFAAETNLRIIVIGGRPGVLDGLPVELRPWSEAREATDLQEFDVGIMPLPDRPFERGKCGLKLLQYMASWKPTIASPIGANKAIVEHGRTGFLADGPDEWLDALRRLRDDPSLREHMGKAGRKRVESEYSLAVASPQLAAMIRSVSANRAVRTG